MVKVAMMTEISKQRRVFLHSDFYGNAPSVPRKHCSYKCYNRLRNSLRSASSSDYSLPRLRTKFGERAFSHAGPAAWKLERASREHIYAPTKIAKFLGNDLKLILP